MTTLRGGASFGQMGLLWQALSNPATTDVLINPDGQVWIDGSHGLQKAPWVVASTRELAIRLAAQAGQRLDEAMPIVDGSLPRGIRLHAVLDPISVGGASVSLRRGQAQVLGLSQLTESGMCTQTQLEQLLQLVAQRANVVISGATGTGKSTLLSALLSHAGAQERIVCVEEAAELKFAHPHVVQLQCRNANVQGSGELGMAWLVRAALRMRPDRLVVGESRGAEIREMLLALNTGHAGSWTTLHANAAADVPARLIALGALAQMSPELVSQQACAGLDAVVHLERRDNVRQVVAIGSLLADPFRVVEMGT